MLTPQIGTTPSVAKLADFGFAKTTTDSALTTTCGTPEYVAPEILIAGAARSQRDKMYGHECDIWSMGVVLYTMLTASNPFDGYNQIKTKRFPREYTNRVSGKTYKLDEAFGGESSENCHSATATDICTCDLNFVPASSP
eukprot:SAG31_NODE_653_length_13152_cov_4.899487_8_plen_140_part_00